MASNKALQLTVKSVAPIVALLFTASELGRSKVAPLSLRNLRTPELTGDPVEPPAPQSATLPANQSFDRTILPG